MSVTAAMLNHKSVGSGVSTEEYLSLEDSTLYAINRSSGRKVLIDTDVRMMTTSSYIKDNEWCLVTDPGLSEITGKKLEPKSSTILSNEETFVAVAYDEYRD